MEGAVRTGATAGVCHRSLRRLNLKAVAEMKVKLLVLACTLITRHEIQA